MAQYCNTTNATLLASMTNCTSPGPRPSCDDPTSTENIIFLVFTCVVLIVTFFGNLLVIVVIVSYERLHQITNFFIVSLATADFLTCFFFHPFTIYRVAHNGVWCSNFDTCALMLVMDNTINSASMCNLAAVSIDRLIAICSPFRYNEIVTKKTSLIMIAVVWMYALLWGLLALVNFTDSGKAHISHQDALGGDSFCSKIDKVYYTCAAIFAFFVPLLIVIVSYTVIFRAALTQAKAVASLDPNQNRRKRTTFFREVKATKVIALVICAFVISWLPLFIIFQVALWDRENTTRFIAEYPQAHKAISYVFLSILPPLNSCINPVIYALFNSNIRSAMAKFLHLPRRSQRRENDHSMVTTATSYPERPSYSTMHTGNGEH